MLRLVEDLAGMNVRLPEFDIGRLEDCLFNETDWNIQYIIADNNAHQSDHKTLIATEFISEIRFKEKTIFLETPKEKIQNKEEISDKPRSSLKLKGEFTRYLSQSDIYSLVPMTRIKGEIYTEDQLNTIKIDDKDVRSVFDMRNYKVFAKDGFAGHLQNFVIDTKNWKIKFLIIRKDKSSEKLSAENHVLFSPDLVTNIERDHCRIDVVLHKSALESNQELTPEKILSGYKDD